MPSVNFGKLLTACHIPPRGGEVPGFVHRTTGDVMLITVGDAVAKITSRCRGEVRGLALRAEARRAAARPESVHGAILRSERVHAGE